METKKNGQNGSIPLGIWKRERDREREEDRLGRKKGERTEI